MPVVITLLYPLLVWLGHGEVEPRLLAGILVLAAMMRILAQGKGKMALVWLAGALALATASMWSNAWMPLKLYPVLVSAVMLGVFAYSLLAPPSLIERLARMQHPDLPPHAVLYTRRVTQVWCLFFFINGAIALVTALWASPAVWSLYTGVISYVLMGCLFGGEYLIRQRVRRIHG